MYIWSNTFRHPMIEMTRTKKCPGLSSGKVIFQNVRHGLEPSIAAASYTSGGIACSAAR